MDQRVNDIARTRTQLDEILQASRIMTRYQSIIDVRNLAPYGHEALSAGPAELGPLALFDMAEEEGALEELDALCTRLACDRYTGTGEHRLFINVHPTALMSPLYRETLTAAVEQSSVLAAERIVLEISERQPWCGQADIQDDLRAWREQGFTFAIDDVGMGHSGLHRLAEVRPEYIKLDRYFTSGIVNDAGKRAIVRSVAGMTRALGAKLIAEGVELVEEAAALGDCGIDLMQGYLFEYPRDIATTGRFDELPMSNGPRAPGGPSIRHLVLERAPVEADTRLETVIEHFHSDASLWSIPVVEGDRPLGIMTRSAALELYTRSFGKELHGRKPVAQFIDQAPPIVSEHTTLNAVSYELTASTGDQLAQEFIVERDGRYLGLVRTSDLLRQLTDQQIRKARYANPLTLLPGNVPISEHIEQQLARGNDFHVGYCDINDFKAFNDAYGYSRGDEAIKLLAAITHEYCRHPEDFVGHVGGDDFVVVLRGDDAETNCGEICRAFRQRAARLYDSNDLQQGGIWGTDRNGARRFFPAMSLSIGLVHPDPQWLTTAHEVSALASAAKKQAKSIIDGGVFVSRRRQ